MIISFSRVAFLGTTQLENNIVTVRKTIKKVRRKVRKDLIMGESSINSFPGKNLVKDLICS
jgi:hypothetical protein